MHILLSMLPASTRYHRMRNKSCHGSGDGLHSRSLGASEQSESVSSGPPPQVCLESVHMVKCCGGKGLF